MRPDLRRLTLGDFRPILRSERWGARASRRHQQGSMDQRHVKSLLRLAVAPVGEQLVAFARASYQTRGRGVVCLTVPSASPGAIRGATGGRVAYKSLRELRRLLGFAEVPHSGADALIRMVETYDPAHHFVLRLAVGTSVAWMKLEVRTAPADHAETVH